MKKLIAGTFVVMAIAWWYWIFSMRGSQILLAKKLKQFNKLIHIETPFQPERVFQYLFLKILQNLRK